MNAFQTGSEVFQNLLQLENNYDLFHVELVNVDILKYLQAESYVIKLGNLVCASFDFRPTFATILENDEIRAQLDFANATSLQASLTAFKLNALDGDGDKLTSGSLADHICGEVELDDQCYCRLENRWFVVQPAAIANFNSMCKMLATEGSAIAPLKKAWDVNSEQEYINKYLRLGGYLVLHRIIVDNVECCDILKIDPNGVTLIHIKQGFNASVRDLAYQIDLSTRLVLNSIVDAEHDYLKRVYNAAINCKESNENYFRDVYLQFQSVTQDGFIDFFRNRSNIKVCFAFVDSAQGPRLLCDAPHEFESLTAKLGLLDAFWKLKKQGIHLICQQIPK